jgi:hypothetical protein
MIKKTFISVIFITLFVSPLTQGLAKERDPWVDYFLDQIAGIRVEISKLETDGVVEKLRHDLALEAKVDELSQSIDELRNYCSRATKLDKGAAI